jgi:hypothetical protein
MEESKYSKPQFIGSFKCGKGRKQTVKMYAVYRSMTPEEQEVIDIQVLRILGFL